MSAERRSVAMQSASSVWRAEESAAEHSLRAAIWRLFVTRALSHSGAISSAMRSMSAPTPSPVTALTPMASTPYSFARAKAAAPSERSLLHITASLRPGEASSRRSSWDTASPPSMAMSSRSALSTISLARDMPMLSAAESACRRPAVSKRRAVMPFMSRVPSSMSRVVPASGVTMARSSPSMALKRELLPALGLPSMAMRAPSRTIREAMPPDMRESISALAARIPSGRAENTSSSNSSG